MSHLTMEKKMEILSKVIYRGFYVVQYETCWKVFEDDQKTAKEILTISKAFIKNEFNAFQVIDAWKKIITKENERQALILCGVENEEA
tara:strand:- start:4690 stop:4953 length:264 start_codon:yes stop_codon:yes gene_type:complete